MTNTQKHRFCPGWLTWSTLALCFVSGAFPCAAQQDRVRVVPQISWEKQGIVSPDGRFGASLATNVVLVVDIKNVCLAWVLPVPYVRSVAFSSDGRLLAAAGGSPGMLLDLQRDLLTPLLALHGTVVVFSSDNNSLFLVTEVQATPGKPPERACRLVHLALTGQVLSEFPLHMEYPTAITHNPDDRSVVVTGHYGNAELHGGPELGPATETISLVTGESAVQKGKLVRSTDLPSRSNLTQSLPAPPRQSLYSDREPEIAWDEMHARLLLHNRDVSIWSLAKGEVIGRLDLRTRKSRWIDHIYGFCGDSSFLGLSITSSGAGIVLLSFGRDASTPQLLQGWPKGGIWSGVASSTACILSPSKQYVATYMPGRDLLGPGTFEVWLTDQPAKQLLSLEMDRPTWIEWAADEKHVYCVSKSRGLRLPDDAVTCLALDGSTHAIKTSSLGLKSMLPPPPKYGQSPQGISIATVHALAQSPLIAIGAGNTEEGWVVVLDSDNGKTSAMLPGLPSRVDALASINGNLLVATLDGGLRLWDPNVGKVLWESNLQRGATAIQYVPGSQYAVCQHMFRSASIVDIRDGKVLRITSNLLGSDSNRQCSWGTPWLVGTGAWTVEFDASRISASLAQTATGDRLVTFCALPDEEWVAFTADGYWHGSPNARQWIRLYQKDQLLTKEAMAEYDNAREVQLTLAKAIAKPAADATSQPVAPLPDRRTSASSGRRLYLPPLQCPQNPVLIRKVDPCDIHDFVSSWR